MKDQPTEDLPVIIGFEGEMNGQRWMLDHLLILGRDPNCDITIPNRQVSRQHAKIFPTPDGILLEDLNSKNGTHKNGHSVSKPELLSDGDIIHIALAQKFIFMNADATLPLDSDEVIITSQGQKMRLFIDKKSRQVWIRDREVSPPLSASQFKLLEILYDNSGQLVPRETAMNTVWGEADIIGISEQALDALVRRLRERLSSLDSTHQYVITVRGHGFRLDNPSE